MSSASTLAAPMAPDASRRLRFAVYAGVAVLSVLRMVYATRVNLAPQEAYYWQYSRHLALSYFDHPPMSAWMIWLSTRVLGQTELGVRMPAILCSAGLLVLMNHLGTRLFSARAGALAALIATTTVLFGLGAVIITPDVPLALFWTATLCVLAELVLPEGRWRSNVATWGLLGALTGFAMLSKYTGGMLVPQTLLACLLLPRGRAALRTAAPYLGVMVAVLVFSPVLIWNAQHAWASILFQTAGRAATVHGVKGYLFGRYVSLQAIGVGPWLFVAIWVGAVKLALSAKRGEAKAQFLACFSLPAMVLFTCVAPFHWVKLNWVAPAYIGVLLSLAGAWASGWTRPRVRQGVALVATLGALLVIAMYAMPLVPSLPFRDRDNLVSGWSELAAHVSHLEDRYDNEGPRPEVIGWGYKTASELAFYLPGQPETKSDSAMGQLGLAYTYWDDDGETAHHALVISDERDPMKDASARLRKQCEQFEELAPVKVHRGVKVVTTFRIWHCLEFTEAKLL